MTMHNRVFVILSPTGSVIGASHRSIAAAVDDVVDMSPAMRYNLATALTMGWNRCGRVDCAGYIAHMMEV